MEPCDTRPGWVLAGGGAACPPAWASGHCDVSQKVMQQKSRGTSSRTSSLTDSPSKEKQPRSRKVKPQANPKPLCIASCFPSSSKEATSYSAGGHEWETQVEGEDQDLQGSL